MTDKSSSLTLAESQEILRYFRELSFLKADVDNALMVPSQSAAMTRLIAWILLNVGTFCVTVPLIDFWLDTVCVQPSTALGAITRTRHSQSQSSLLILRIIQFGSN